MCVCELADILDMPQSSLSSHLQVIRRSGMLDSERCGKWVYYRLTRNYRPLLRSLTEFFEISPAGDKVLRADQQRALQRMSQRDAGCCPLPKSLATLKPLAAKRPVAGTRTAQPS